MSTFGSAELARRESGRVRGLHRVVQGSDDQGRPYAASDPDLLRWVHLAFTDAFLAAHEAVGHELSRRFGHRWSDAYVALWARSAAELGATDLPTSEAELVEAIAAYGPDLEPVPADLRTFLSAAPGLSAPEQLFYKGFSSAASQLVSPTIAPLAQVRGRGGRPPPCRSYASSCAACSSRWGRTAPRRRPRATASGRVRNRHGSAPDARPGVHLCVEAGASSRWQAAHGRHPRPAARRDGTELLNALRR